MLEEVHRAFKSKDCIVSGFGNQVSDAVAYKNVGIHANYNFNIKDSIIYMLSGKYKFTMEAFFNNVDTLFPEIKGSQVSASPDK